MADMIFVGVLNITPDSFSDGGEFNSVDTALAQAKRLFDGGATLLDVGAESTNPWSQPLTATQEIERLTPIVPQLIKAFGQDVFSLDTYHPETALWAIQRGMKPIINDVSGLHNPQMRELVVEHGLRVIISHLPKTANGVPTRAHTEKQIDSIDTVRDELSQTTQSLEAKGVPREHIILDPGIGFGKTMRLNWQLIGFAAQVPDYNVMLGYSRKRFLHTDPATGHEIAELISLKKQAGPAYETWLAAQHHNILEKIETQHLSLAQTIYLRVHTIPNSAELAN